MSLTTALSLSTASLLLTESQISTVSSNITNADKAGYTRKTYESDYVTTGENTSPAGGTTVTAVYDTYLYNAMLEDLTDSGYYDVIATYLNNYADSLGSTDEDSTLASALSDLESSFALLAQTPEDSALKAQVVQDAQMLAYEIRNLSETVQDLRTQADNEIETVVADANQILETLENLNEKITRAEAMSQSTADLEDERRSALEELSAILPIDYFIDANNQLKVYTSGQALLNGRAYELSYTGSNSVNASLSYPAHLSGITVNGNDITDTITGGTLGGLLELRDETLPAEQDKLDALATVLIEQTNALLNTGTSLPARETIIGDTIGFSAADGFTATGSIGIAMVDGNGVVTSSATIDLSAQSNVQDVLDAINGAFGGDITASLDADGKVQLVSTVSGEGIAIDQLDSAVDPDGKSFSAYFGLNNLFSGEGAADIDVSDYLQDSSDYLATATFDSTALVGETGVFVGDGSLAEALGDVFSADVSFVAAGDFSAQTNSLADYATKIMSSLAVDAANSEENAESALALYTQTSDSLVNLSGVNIDEEMARLVELESHYEAAATVLSVVQDLFEDLISAVR